MHINVCVYYTIHLNLNLFIQPLEMNHLIFEGVLTTILQVKRLSAWDNLGKGALYIYIYIYILRLTQVGSCTHLWLSHVCYHTEYCLVMYFDKLARVSEGQIFISFCNKSEQLILCFSRSGTDTVTSTFNPLHHLFSWEHFWFTWKQILTWSSIMTRDLQDQRDSICPK